MEETGRARLGTVGKRVKRESSERRCPQEIVWEDISVFREVEGGVNGHRVGCGWLLIENKK